MPRVDPTNTLRSLDRSQKQIRFGIARGLTWTAQQARDDLKLEATVRFDRPTRWTLSGFYFLPATRETLVAVVEIKDEIAGGTKATPSAKVLAPHIFGGSRPKKRSEIKLGLAGLMGNKGFYVPAKGVKLNQYGNIPGPTIQRILSDVQAAEARGGGFSANRTERSTKRNKRYMNTRYFVPQAGSKLPPGVWKRQGKTIEPVLIFVPEVSYRIIFPFYELVAASVRKHIERNIQRSVAMAFRTAR